MHLLRTAFIIACFFFRLHESAAEDLGTMSGDDPSAYLRPEKTKDMMDQTRMFDSKKWTWVPDDEEGFKSAAVKGQKGERVTVQYADGQVRTCVCIFILVFRVRYMDVYIYVV